MDNAFKSGITNADVVIVQVLAPLLLPPDCMALLRVTSCMQAAAAVSGFVAAETARVLTLNP